MKLRDIVTRDNKAALVAMFLASVGVCLPLASGPSQALEISQADGSQLQQPAEQLVPAETVATYPEGYFFENIVVDVNGTLYITENTQGQIIRRKADGGADIFSDVDVSLAGLALDIDGTLVATGHGETGEQYVFEFAEDGTPNYQQLIPGAGFLNGIALFRPSVFLIADSDNSTIWQFDSNTQQATVWLQDDTLAPNADMPDLPAANGIKIFDGAVYVSNSAQATLTRIPILEDGSAGEPAVVLSNIVLDDFAFSSSGSLYGTTHIFDSVVVITPDGEQRTIATAEQGVTGSTALAFGATERDRQSIYVVGDGGLFGAESESDTVKPEIVRLAVGELGLSKGASLDWITRPEQTEGIESQLVQCTTAPNTDSLRTIVGPQYLRYLELNIDSINYAGQLYANGRDSVPSDRLYFVTSDTPETALNPHSKFTLLPGRCILHLHRFSFYRTTWQYARRRCLAARGYLSTTAR